MNKADLLHLVEQAGFVFRGKVLGKGAPGVPLGAAEGKSVSVAVEQILRSTEAMSGLRGKQVVVVSEDAAAMEQGATFFFLTNVVVLGDHVIVRGSRVESSRETAEEVTEAVKLAGEQPLRRRLNEAQLVITGRVLASHRVETPAIRRSEHDPEWWIARVQVLSVLKGGKVAAEIDVLFANSTDIAWYRSPKLHVGTDGVLLLHPVTAEDAVPEAGRARHKATDPLDFHPIDRQPEVERLIGQEKREH
jgi:hypothetical protein